MSYKSYPVNAAAPINLDLLNANGVQVFDGIGITDLFQKVTEIPNTTKAITYELVGIPGTEFIPKERSNKNILTKARSLGLSAPPVRSVLLAAAQWRLPAMPQYIVFMHEPLHGFPDNLYRLMIARYGYDQQRFLDTCSPYDSDVWKLENDSVFMFMKQ